METTIVYRGKMGDNGQKMDATIGSRAVETGCYYRFQGNGKES